MTDTTSRTPSEFFISSVGNYEDESGIVTLFQPTGDSIVDNALIKMANRSRVGQDKYGVTMDRTDLTPEQWLMHLQEELMDATIYIEKHLQMLRLVQGGQHE